MVELNYAPPCFHHFIFHAINFAISLIWNSTYWNKIFWGIFRQTIVSIVSFCCWKMTRLLLQEQQQFFLGYGFLWPSKVIQWWWGCARFFFKACKAISYQSPLKLGMYSIAQLCFIMLIWLILLQTILADALFMAQVFSIRAFRDFDLLDKIMLARSVFLAFFCSFALTKRSVADLVEFLIRNSPTSKFFNRHGF